MIIKLHKTQDRRVLDKFGMAWFGEKSYSGQIVEFDGIFVFAIGFCCFGCQSDDFGPLFSRDESIKVRCLPSAIGLNFAQ